MRRLILTALIACFMVGTAAAQSCDSGRQAASRCRQEQLHGEVHEERLERLALRAFGHSGLRNG